MLFDLITKLYLGLDVEHMARPTLVLSLWIKSKAR